MTDTIRGKVTRIIDGDTFDLFVTHHGKHNSNKYNSTERIRIADTDAPELSTHAGVRTKLLLHSILAEKEVRCHVQARDAYGRIVATVQILNAS